MILFFKKNKIKIIFVLLLLPIFFSYFFLDNKCLNINKLYKSYIDFGYSNIKPCYLTSAKKIIQQKAPNLFRISSDINRHYFSNFSKDILDLKISNDYKIKEKELFKEVIELSKTGLPGVVNDKNFQTDYIDLKYRSSFKYYFRQNKDHSNTKFYDEINLGKINEQNKPKLEWKHVSLPPNTKLKNWKSLIETSPTYINGKIIYVSADLKLIALDAITGKEIWQKELLHKPSMRGFIVETDLNEKENIFICVGSNIYKINAKNGKILKNFGDKGFVTAWTAFSPVIFKNYLVVVSRNKVHVFDKVSGKRSFTVPIFNNKSFLGALPWGGMALDESNGIIYFSTGNPRPKVYGVKREGINEGSNSIIAIDLNKKKVIWKFKETYHDLWNLDIAFPPVLADIEINNKIYKTLISSTKIGNVVMLERLTGKPIFDINLINTPKSKIISEIVSPFQLQINKPDPITKFEWTPKDMNELNNEYSKKILNNLGDYEYGLFTPPAPNKAFIYMAEGPIWEGGAYNSTNNKMYLAVNQTSTITRTHLKSLWPHSKIKKDFSNEFSIYKDICSSCHGKNRNGVYIQGNKPDNKQMEVKVIPSLVGYHLFEDLKNKINNYENYKKKHTENLIDEDTYKAINNLFKKWDEDLLKNKRISVNEMSSFFADKNKNFMNNYPQGEIVSYDMSSGNIIWRVPFGYEEEKKVGTFNRGGLSLTNDGILFATGTPDKKIIAIDAESGEELWSYQMELSGNAPPTIFEINGSKYISVIATGGYNFKFPDRGSILYTFKVN